MITEVGRDIADAQAAQRRAIVGMAARLTARCAGKTLRPPQTFFENRLRLRRLETERIGEVAVSGRVARVEFQGSAEACDRRIELANVLEDAAQFVKERGMIRLQVRGA